jgi:hypothetical protein
MPHKAEVPYSSAGSFPCTGTISNISALANKKFLGVQNPFFKKGSGHRRLRGQEGKSTNYFPTYIDLAKKTEDMELAMQLVDIMDVLGPLYETLRDTLTLAGAEAYLSARVIYDTFKVAVKSGLPGSEVISKDLGSIFKKTRKPNPDTGTSVTDPIATKKKAA